VHSCIWVTRSQINQANSYSTPTTTDSFCIHLLFQDHTFSIQQRSVYINRNIQQTTISRANARWFTKLVYTVKEPQRFAEQKLCWKLSRNRLQQRTGHSWPMGLDPSHNQGELKIFTNLTLLWYWAYADCCSFVLELCWRKHGYHLDPRDKIPDKTHSHEAKNAANLVLPAPPRPTNINLVRLHSTEPICRRRR